MDSAPKGISRPSDRTPVPESFTSGAPRRASLGCCQAVDHGTPIRTERRPIGRLSGFQGSCGATMGRAGKPRTQNGRGFRRAWPKRVTSKALFKEPLKP